MMKSVASWELWSCGGEENKNQARPSLLSCPPIYHDPISHIYISYSALLYIMIFYLIFISLILSYKSGAPPEPPTSSPTPGCFALE